METVSFSQFHWSFKTVCGYKCHVFILVKSLLVCHIRGHFHSFPCPSRLTNLIHFSINENTRCFYISTKRLKYAAIHKQIWTWDGGLVYMKNVGLKPNVYEVYGSTWQCDVGLVYIAHVYNVYVCIWICKYIYDIYVCVCGYVRPCDKAVMHIRYIWTCNEGLMYMSYV